MLIYKLYLKTSPLGLKYLGKTTKDPFKYIGSGKIWIRHIAKHNLTNDDIKTEILFETADPNEFKEFAIQKSIELDIVESKEYANLIREEGDGGFTYKKGTALYEKIKHKLKNKKGAADHLNGVGLSKEERDKIFMERSKLINYKDPERLRKIKENTDWEALFKNRKIDYSKFLHKTHEKNKKAILQIGLDGTVIKEWNSATDASKELNVQVGTIRSWIYNNRIGLNSKWVLKNEYEKIHK